MSPRSPRRSLKRPPKDCARLGGFPKRRVSESETLWRVTRAGNGPWFFGSSLEGRFDLPTPDGTCYLGFDPFGALLEVLAGAATVTTEFLEDRRIRELNLPRPHEAADVTAPGAVEFGITLEINTIVPYEIPQAWALCLRRVGNEGILYFARHSPAPVQSLALFGRSGERKAWRRGRGRRIAGELVRGLEENYGVRVVPVPTYSELEIR